MNFPHTTDSTGRYLYQLPFPDFITEEDKKQIRAEHLIEKVTDIERDSSFISGRIRVGRTDWAVRANLNRTNPRNPWAGAYGFCAQYRCWGNCIHVKALLMADYEQNGPFIMREDEYQFRERKHREAREAEINRRNELRNTKSGQVSVLDAIGYTPSAEKGPVLYDIPACLKDIQTTEYHVLRMQAVESSDNASAPSVSVSENTTRNDNRYISVSVSGHDLDAYFSGTARFTPNKLVSADCSCPDCETDDTWCCHKLMMARKALNFAAGLKVSDMTDDAAVAFFDSIHGRIAQQAVAKIEKQPEKRKVLNIEPCIVTSEGTAKVFFRVGHINSRALILRNLNDIVDAYRNGTPYAVSKKETLDFSREDFTDACQPIFTLVQRRVQEIIDANAKLAQKTYYSIELGLPYQQELSGSFLDQFYDAANGMSCEYTDKTNDTTSVISIGHTKMNFALTVDRISDAHGAFLGVVVSGLVPVTIEGSGVKYILNGSYLSRVDEKEEHALLPFTKVADASGLFRFHVGLNKLQEFYYRILPDLIDSSIVTIDDHCAEEAEQFLPPEPVFSFYCDLDEDRLTIRATVAYDEKKYTMSPRSYSGEGYHDVDQEKRVLEAIQQFADHYNKKKECFDGALSEDGLYDFLHDGIGALSRFGEVSGTDAFRARRIRTSPHVTVGVSVESGLMDLSVTSSDLSKDELLGLLESYQKKKKYYRLKGGDYIDLNSCDELDELIDLCGSLDLVPTDAIRRKCHLPVFRALYLDRMLEEHDELSTTRDRTYRAIIKNFKTVKDADYEVPVSLENTLRPYQTFGFKWLSTVENAGFGSILADEMGLGKTLQIISLLLAAKENGNTKPSLVVCPASLVYNWIEEIHRFAPTLSATALSGPQSSRKALFQVLSGGKAPSETAASLPAPSPAPAPAPAKRRGRPPKNPRPQEVLPAVLPAGLPAAVPAPSEAAPLSDIYVTSYDLLKRDISQYESLSFFACVLDEAQYIKNQKAAVSKAVKILHADHRFALTGTPIENRLSELWSIFDFLMPGFLYSSPEFIERFENPITKSKDEEATQKLKKMVGPFILRRKKEDVLKDLPAKLEEVRFARFESQQQRLYDAQVVHMRELIGKSSNTGEDKLKILAELTRLREICCDPSLIFENYDGESAKRTAVLELIQGAIDGGHRMLVFSQFTSMLSLLEEDLKANSIPYFKIIGSTPKEQRLNLVHQFNEGTTPVFLISLKAGGVGLNLIGADVVIHYDPWWNLAAQNQATDRAHRIGQTRQVTVFRLIAKNTIEEKILELQNAKKDLADAILEGRSESLMSLSNEELLALLN